MFGFQGCNSQNAYQNSKQGRPLQKQSEEAVWSGSALFAYAFLATSVWNFRSFTVDCATSSLIELHDLLDKFV